jgi:2-amino-4-hydroxy-6-hydroxymethyldihydropteridine diphosphokinase
MKNIPKDQIAAIALGSNLGDSETILTGAIADLQNLPCLTLLKCSPWYHTPPIGPPQPNYINGCILVHYSRSAPSLMHGLLEIEQNYGRERTIRWGPRTLDLDLLFFGSRICNSEFLILPHPRMHERRFVLEPLADIHPEWNHPQLNQSVAELLNQVLTS